MVEAVVRDQKRLLPCAAYCDREYGVGGYYVGVPVILGGSGVERIMELALTESERAAFQKSVAAVKGLVGAMGRLTGLNRCLPYRAPVPVFGFGVLAGVQLTAPRRMRESLMIRLIGGTYRVGTIHHHTCVLVSICPSFQTFP